MNKADFARAVAETLEKPEFAKYTPEQKGVLSKVLADMTILSEGRTSYTSEEQKMVYAMTPRVIADVLTKGASSIVPGSPESEKMYQQALVFNKQAYEILDELPQEVVDKLSPRDKSGLERGRNFASVTENARREIDIARAENNPERAFSAVQNALTDIMPDEQYDTPEQKKDRERWRNRVNEFVEKGDFMGAILALFFPSQGSGQEKEQSRENAPQQGDAVQNAPAAPLAAEAAPPAPEEVKAPKVEEDPVVRSWNVNSKQSGKIVAEIQQKTGNFKGATSGEVMSIPDKDYLEHEAIINKIMKEHGATPHGIPVKESQQREATLSAKILEEAGGSIGVNTNGLVSKDEVKNLAAHVAQLQSSDNNKTEKQFLDNQAKLEKIFEAADVNSDGLTDNKDITALVDAGKLDPKVAGDLAKVFAKLNPERGDIVYTEPVSPGLGGRKANDPKTVLGV